MAQHKAPYTLFKRNKNKKNSKWYYRLADDPKRIPHSTGKTTKWEAEQFVEELLSLKITQEPISLEEYSKEFFIWGKCKWTQRRKAQGHAATEVMSQMRRGQLTNHIIPAFGTLNLTEINPVQVENWLLELELANSTKNHIRDTFSIVLDEARRERLIHTNPISDVGRFSKSIYKKRDTLSMAELQILFPKDDKELLLVWKRYDLAAMYFLLLTSGIRSGEVRALLWKSVLWNEQAILIVQAVKGGNEIGIPKGGDKRGIIVPSRTIVLLNKWRMKSVYKKDEDFVFPGQNGDKPLGKEAVSKNFIKGIERAGIDITNKNIVAHSLRHTYNTIMKGILTAEVLREFTGHRSEAMTKRYDNPQLIDRLRQFHSSIKDIDDTWK